MDLDEKDLNDLAISKALLENPGIAAKLSHVIGLPLEKGFEMLPRNWHLKIAEITKSALEKAVHTAVFTLKHTRTGSSSNALHKVAVATTGGIGGFLGLPGISVELPVSTTIMLRSIADIARSEGEDILSPEAKLACIEVFALGGPTAGDNASESGYFAVRAALAQSVSNAAEHIASRGLTDKGAPALVRLILLVAERFSFQVSEKAAAQAIPAVGAVGGATINTLFMNHFQQMAKGHFMVRRLERKYGAETVQTVYNTI